MELLTGIPNESSEFVVKLTEQEIVDIAWSLMKFSDMVPEANRTWLRQLSYQFGDLVGVH